MNRMMIRLRSAMRNLGIAQRLSFVLSNRERASHEAVATPFTSLETLYGEDASNGILPADGPAFHIWRIR